MGVPLAAYTSLYQVLLPLFLIIAIQGIVYCGIWFSLFDSSQETPDSKVVSVLLLLCLSAPHPFSSCLLFGFIESYCRCMRSKNSEKVGGLLEALAETCRSLPAWHCEKLASMENSLKLSQVKALVPQPHLSSPYHMHMHTRSGIHHQCCQQLSGTVKGGTALNICLAPGHVC